MKPACRPLISAIKSRGFAAQAATKAEAASSLSKQDPKITHLPNGAIVASVEDNSPISRVAVYYNAGPRYETNSNIGVSHCLRNASSLSTQRATRFGITRNIDQIGGSMSKKGFEFLGYAATCPAFKSWEVNDAVTRLQMDLSVLENESQIQLMEILHKAAYRQGLGNSLYTPKHMVGKHTPAMLAEFADRHLVSGNMTVIGSGVDHDSLVFQVKKMYVKDGAPVPTEKSVYHGGENRIDAGGHFAHVAITTEGASLGSKDLLALGVLQKVMGEQPRVKYSDNTASSKIGKAVAKATSGPFAASCINAAYTDSGLFGFHVSADSNDMGNVLKSLVSTFSEATKSSVTDADVERAKSQLKASLHMEFEDGGMVLEDMGLQAMLSGQIVSAVSMESAIEAITTADVQAVAKKIINGKPSMGAVGNLGNTPYLDQLM